MIDIIQTPASHVAAFRARGKIEDEDIQRAKTALERAMQEHEQVALLIELDEWEGISAEALRDDLGYWFDQLGSLDRFGRAAVVTDRKWVDMGARLEDKLLPGVEVRAFPTERRDEARAWVAEPPAPATRGLEAIPVQGGESAGGTPILAYAVRGRVTADDIGQLDADFKREERFRLLLRLDDFAMPGTGAFTSGLAGMKMDALRKMERYAVVGGPGLDRRAARDRRAAAPHAHPPLRRG